MNFEPASGISFFQRYLTLWGLLCMAAGIAVGHFMSGLVTLLNGLTVSGISLPITVLIWIMIFPMMMEVDFESIRSVGKNPKGLFVTWIVNWLVKPFSMYLVASFFLMVLFRSLISTDLARQYLAGAVLLGAAPCTAMVFVWSTLTKGTPPIQWCRLLRMISLFLWHLSPSCVFFLGVSQVAVPLRNPLFERHSLCPHPLVVGTLTRLMVTWRKGIAYFESVFCRDLTM